MIKLTSEELKQIEAIKDLSERIFANRILTLRCDMLFKGAVVAQTFELYSSDFNGKHHAPVATISNIDEPLIITLECHLNKLIRIKKDYGTVQDYNQPQRW